jgi:hypothetical protein
MRFDSDCPSVLDLEVEKNLIGVEEVPETSEWGPLHSGFGVRTEVAFQNQMAVSSGDVKLVVEGIKYLDAVARTFGKGDTVPSILTRAILARFALARPARDLQFRLARA